jgi:hypothetical protein
MQNNKLAFLKHGMQRILSLREMAVIVSSYI